MCLFSFNCAMSFVLQCYEAWLVAKIFEFCLLTPPWLARWRQRAPAPWAWSMCSPLGNVKNIEFVSFGQLKTWRRWQVWSLTTIRHPKEAKYLGKLCYILSVFICYKTNALVSQLPRLKSQAQHDVWWEIVLANTEPVSPDFAKYLPQLAERWRRDPETRPVFML